MPRKVSQQEIKRSSAITSLTKAVALGIVQDAPRGSSVAITTPTVEIRVSKQNGDALEEVNDEIYNLVGPSINPTTGQTTEPIQPEEVAVAEGTATIRAKCSKRIDNLKPGASGRNLWHLTSRISENTIC